MVERVFQYLDPEGKPNGGMVFRAPDEETLGTLILMTRLSPGWTMIEVEGANDVVKIDPVGEVVTPFDEVTHG